MASAKNKVIAGDYSGWDVICGFGKLHFMHRLSRVNLNSATIQKYEVVDSQNGSSFWGSFLRGYISRSVLGSAGLMASTIRSANRKAIWISIEFRDGKKSLIEVDEVLYRKVIKVLY